VLIYFLYAIFKHTSSILTLPHTTAICQEINLGILEIGLSIKIKFRGV